MKKRLFSCLAIFVAIISAVIFAVSFNNGAVAYAATSEDEETPPEVTETTILSKDDYFADSALWAALVRIIERDYGGDGATVRAGDLKNATELDLSGQNISSLDGLEYLIFSSSLKTLNISNNKLTEIDEVHIDKMLGLENLYASNNSIEMINMPASVALKNIDIRNNKVSSIDLSNMKKNNETTPGACDLRQNNFSDLANISLPTASAEQLDIKLAQNYLTDATVADFGGHKVSLQLQGMKAGATNAVSNVYVRLTNDAEGGEYTNLVAKVYYRRGSAYFQDTLDIDDNLVATSDQNGKLILPAGKMYIRYFNNNIHLDGNQENGDLYFDHEIDIKPAAPIMIVKVDGKTIDYELGQGISKDFDVVGVTDLTNATMKISINGNDAQEGNTATIKQRGNYTIACTVTYDGLTSDAGTLTVKNTNSTGIMWGLIIFAGVVIVVAAVYFILRWFKNGAVVTPLTDAEIRNIERRKKLNKK